MIVTHTPLLSFRKIKTTMHVTDVMVPTMKSFSTNVYHLISTCTHIVYKKDKYSFNFYFILDLVHVISSVRNSSNDNAIVIFNALPWHHDSNKTKIHYTNSWLSGCTLPCPNLLETIRHKYIIPTHGCLVVPYLVLIS